MKENILLINACKEKLHELEFVKPIEDILKKNNIMYVVRNYRLLNKKDLDNCSKAIICGTPLKDSDYFSNIEKFSWINDFKKHILGICAGMQVIGLAFEGFDKKLIKKKTEIGFYYEEFKREFLGLKGKQEFYHLHNNYISLWSSDWDVFCKGNSIVQAVKNKEKDIYGVLFHPEVRQKDMILEFCKLK